MYLTKKIYWPILLLIDIVGNILFFWKKLKRPPKNERIKKVLFIRLEHIGDMIITTPVFETWKKNYPNCEVHVLCRELTAPIINNSPYVDKIFTYNAPWFIRQQKNKEPLSVLISRLHYENYDIIFEMHGDPNNNYLCNRIATSKTYTIGYSCRGAGFFLNKTVIYDEKKQMIKQNLSLIEDFCKKIYKIGRAHV